MIKANHEIFVEFPKQIEFTRFGFGGPLFNTSLDKQLFGEMLKMHKRKHEQILRNGGPKMGVKRKVCFCSLFSFKLGCGVGLRSPIRLGCGVGLRSPTGSRVASVFALSFLVSSLAVLLLLFYVLWLFVVLVCILFLFVLGGGLWGGSCLIFDLGSSFCCVFCGCCGFFLLVLGGVCGRVPV